MPNSYLHPGTTCQTQSSFDITRTLPTRQLISLLRMEVACNPTRRRIHHRTRRKPEPDTDFAFRRAERDGDTGWHATFNHFSPNSVRCQEFDLYHTSSSAPSVVHYLSHHLTPACVSKGLARQTWTEGPSRWTGVRWRAAGAGDLPTIATPFAPALLGGPWRFLSYDSTTLDQLRRGMTEAGPRHSRPQKIPIDPIIPHRRQLTTHGPEACSPQPEDTGSQLALPNHPSHTDQNEGTRDITSHTWRGCVDDPSAMLIPSVGFPHLCCLSPITPRSAPVYAHEASEIELSLPAASVLPLPHPNCFKPTSSQTPSSSFQFLSFLFTKCNIVWSDTVTIFSVESPSAWLLATAQDGVDRAK
ncbi:hypothetical protein CMEL01_04844 [Colletotrichum melonis]|uniref:Uncharacterized protein n=1 Tax=Colletotrichum melonis TaxID=1209925 RepID=A0AAI9UBW3_9PEZI|nr:hypothetical protein CMEL01_04844 [Colletotrichum melonis]